MSYIWMSLLDGLSGTRSFVESEMTAEMPTKNTGAVVIRFVSDDKIADGEWKLHDLGNNSYEVHAADYYGFTAAGRYFKGYVGKNRATEHPYPTSAMGSYLDEGSLSKAEESNAYAFTHTGDIRVMFNNILFHEPSIVQRDYYASLLFSAYKPDVLGLQEVNIGRRGDVEEANGGVIALLAEYGYVETIDPRVQNAYPKTELIPGTDAGLTMGDEYAGQLHPGYGGGKKVEVDGKTFYTYYNHTPLLYNQNTTRYIDGGYYWYLNQWDQRPGQVHDNSASDCGTKSATWGLFEDIETGTRYIVISTHMCTRSEYIRDLQAAEIVALIDQLIEQYDVPVLLGGDYNAAASAESVKILREGGLVNPKTEKLATVHTTSLATTHPEDPVYDTDLKLTVPANGNALNATGAGNEIDHIMVKNHEDMEIFVYGTVFDEMALSSSDHLPLYLDFSVNTAQ